MKPLTIACKHIGFEVRLPGVKDPKPAPLGPHPSLSMLETVAPLKSDVSGATVAYLRAS